MASEHSVLRQLAQLPDHLLNDLVDIFKALSDPTRAQLIYLLTRREYSVSELSDQVPVSASAVSHHLAKLRAIRLVQTRRDGNLVFYRIDDDDHVANLFREALFHLEHIHEHVGGLPIAEESTPGIP